MDKLLTAAALSFVLPLSMSVACSVAAAGVMFKRWLRKRKAWSYVRRDDAGNLYVRDPQTGTMRRLETKLTPGGVKIGVREKKRRSRR